MLLKYLLLASNWRSVEARSYLSNYGSEALCWALVLFVSFLIFYTVGRTPWMEISSLQGLYLHTGQHKHRINAHRHPCLKWDSNPRSQCSNEWRKVMTKTARPLLSAEYGTVDCLKHFPRLVQEWLNKSRTIWIMIGGLYPGFLCVTEGLPSKLTRVEVVREARHHHAAMRANYAVIIC
jgi:hypothetical protein